MLKSSRSVKRSANCENSCAPRPIIKLYPAVSSRFLLDLRKTKKYEWFFRA